MARIQILNERFPIVDASRKTKGPDLHPAPHTKQQEPSAKANPAQERQPQPTTDRCGAADKRPQPHTEEQLLHFCIVNTP